VIHHTVVRYSSYTYNRQYYVHGTPIFCVTILHNPTTKAQLQVVRAIESDLQMDVLSECGEHSLQSQANPKGPATQWRICDFAIC